jgi:hypothetical protein
MATPPTQPAAMSKGPGVCGGARARFRRTRLRASACVRAGLCVCVPVPSAHSRVNLRRRRDGSGPRRSMHSLRPPGQQATARPEAARWRSNPRARTRACARAPCSGGLDGGSQPPLEARALGGRAAAASRRTRASKSAVGRSELRRERDTRAPYRDGVCVRACVCASARVCVSHYRVIA